MRTKILIPFFLLCVCCGLIPAKPPSVDPAERSVAVLTPCGAAGSGVIASDRHVITARHVVLACGPTPVFLVRLSDGTLRLVEVEILGRDDLARLVLADDQDPLPAFPPLRARAAPPGARVCHYPSIPKAETVCGAITESGHGVGGLEHDEEANVTPGNSGAGVYDGDGYLVGIVVHWTGDVNRRGGASTPIAGHEWIVPR